MIKLRPHHLLCTQGYSGKGYNKDFIKNMDYILDNINVSNIKLVFNNDDICSKCPNMLDENHCKTNDKVKTMDEKVIHYFNLKEDIFNYKLIVEYINENITESIFDDICKDCEWYPISNCKKNILK